MYEPRDLTVYLDAMDTDRHCGRLSYAAMLAQLWNAHLVVAYAPEDIALDIHAGYVRGPQFGAFSMPAGSGRRRVKRPYATS